MYTGYQKRMCDEAAQRSDLQVRLVSTPQKRGLDAMKADQAVVAVWSCGRVVVQQNLRPQRRCGRLIRRKQMLHSQRRQSDVLWRGDLSCVNADALT